MASAGDLDQINVLPATVAVAIRTIPGVDHPDLVRRITSIARGAGGAGEVPASITVLVDRPTVVYGPGSTWITPGGRVRRDRRHHPPHPGLRQIDTAAETVDRPGGGKRSLIAYDH